MLIIDPGPRRRVLLTMLVVVGTLAATLAVASVLAADGLSIAESAMLPVFALTFAWIAYGFWTTLAGFLIRVFGRRVADGLNHPTSEPAPGARTALLMPIYHEDAEQVGARLVPMLHSLARSGQLALFDLFILSDSRDPQRVRAEQEIWARLRTEFAGACGVFYRNRAENHGRKAGNIAEFCRRWGGRYPYIVVLDADSVMAGSTLLQLVRLMEANPGAGLIQTLPQPIGAQTLFARILQFGARLYSPVSATGLAYWFPGRSNYWGHNAIIRTSAFMASSGLPRLPGAPPLGGEILSHDFVEAALLQRAGWSVWFLPELGGSYEELPPTLSDYLSRDRRWCQGNLQHVRLLAAKGLRAVSRLHLALGAMSYVASLLWLVLLGLGTFEAAGIKPGPQFAWTDEGMLAVWPTLDTRPLIAVAGVTLGMLILPKLLALILALAVPEQRRAFGGGRRLGLAVLAEIGFSALLAPVLMIQHSKCVLGILIGRGVTWTAQQRHGQVEGWRAAAANYGDMAVLACLWGAIVLIMAPSLLIWLGPVLAGFALAVPVAVFTSRSDLGGAARLRGWFLIPEESAPLGELTALAPGMLDRDRLPMPAGGSGDGTSTGEVATPRAATGS